MKRCTFQLPRNTQPRPTSAAQRVQSPTPGSRHTVYSTEDGKKEVWPRCTRLTLTAAQQHVLNKCIRSVVIILAPDVLSKHDQEFPLISFLCAKTIPSFSKPSPWISTGWLLKAWTIVFLSFIIWFTILMQALQIQPEVLGKRVWDLSYLMNTVFLSSLTPHLYEQDMGLYNVRWMNDLLKYTPLSAMHVIAASNHQQISFTCCGDDLHYLSIGLKYLKLWKMPSTVDIDTDPLLGWQ